MKAVEADRSVRGVTGETPGKGPFPWAILINLRLGSAGDVAAPLALHPCEAGGQGAGKPSCRPEVVLGSAQILARLQPWGWQPAEEGLEDSDGQN